VNDGARAVLKGIIKSFPDANMDVLVVWIAMMGGDTYEAAQKAAHTFNDGRVKQFFDPKQIAGRAIADSLGHDGEVAWDFYLFYPVQSTWRELPPAPEVYMHQLRSGWADQSRLFEKSMLKKKLAETMKLLFP
jgi:hypothetical protein